MVISDLYVLLSPWFHELYLDRSVNTLSRGVNHLHGNLFENALTWSAHFFHRQNTQSLRGCQTRKDYIYS